MVDSPIEPPAQSDTAGKDHGEGPRRPKFGWRGRLTSGLVGLAGGMAVNDLSGTLGYRGLSGVLAVAGVAAAATWVRGLDARALLPRYAPWLLLTPAAVVATIAAFSARPAAGTLTAVAVILTMGAVLLATSLMAAVTTWCAITIAALS